MVIHDGDEFILGALARRGVRKHAGQELEVVVKGHVRIHLDRLQPWVLEALQVHNEHLHNGLILATHCVIIDCSGQPDARLLHHNNAVAHSLLLQCCSACKAMHRVASNGRALGTSTKCGCFLACTLLPRAV